MNQLDVPTRIVLVKFMKETTLNNVNRMRS